MGRHYARLIIWAVSLIFADTGCVVVVGSRPAASLTDTAGRLSAQSEDTEALRDLVRQRVRAGNDGNVDAWLACFADDAVIMPANARAIVGKEAIEEWERGFEGFRPQVEMTIDEVVVRGDWAYMRSRISGVFIKGGESFPINGKELAVFRRVQGRWKYHRICGNKDTGPRPANAKGVDGG